MGEGPRWFRFFRREVLPRGRIVFLHRNAVGSVAFAFAGACVVRLLPTDAPFPATTFATFCTATLAFAGLSFGGAMTGSVLAVGWPPDRVLRTMVVNSTEAETTYRPVADGVVQAKNGKRIMSQEFPQDFRSLYSDLVFVFLWTAVAQLLLAVVSMLCLAAVGESVLSPREFALGPFVALVVMLGFSTYAILQLTSSIKALSSVARNRDRFLRQDVLNGEV